MAIHASVPVKYSTMPEAKAKLPLRTRTLSPMSRDSPYTSAGLFVVMDRLYLFFLPLVNGAVAPHGALRAKDNFRSLGENDKVLLRAAILAPAVVLVHAHIIRWNLYGNQEPAHLFFLIFPCFLLLTLFPAMV